MEYGRRGFGEHLRSIFNLKLIGSRTQLNYTFSNHVTLSKEPKNAVYEYNFSLQTFTFHSEVKADW